MKLASFARFVAPSAALMLLLMALPLAMTFYLSVRNSALQMETVTVSEITPFGTREVTTQRAVLGPDGRAVTTCRFVGLDYFRTVLGLGDGAASAPPDASGGGAVPENAAQARQQRSTEFIGALRFTLLYTFATTPFQVSTPHALPCTPSAAGATRVTVQWQPEGGQDVRRKEAPMP